MFLILTYVMIVSFSRAERDIIYLCRNMWRLNQLPVFICIDL